MKEESKPRKESLYEPMQLFAAPPQSQVDASRKRVRQRLSSHHSPALQIVQIDDPRAATGLTVRRWLLAAAVVVLTVLAALGLKVISPGNVYATVETLQGSVYKVTDGMPRSVTVGERINVGTPLRTAEGAAAVVKLSTGARIEMQSKSELSLEHTQDGVRIMVATAPQLPLQFEVADVHISPASTAGRRVGHMDGITGNIREPWVDTVRGGRYELHNATMADLITTAYGVEPHSVLGGPGWMFSDWDRFDVIAKPPAGKTTAAAIKTMLQSLLADRFKLVVRTSMKPLPAWELSKGSREPKLKLSDMSGEPACHIVDNNERVSCRNVTMDAFAAAIRRGALTTLPVLNSTGIEGSWDFDLNYSVTRGYFGVADDNPILDAVEKQLGLRLALKDVPQPVLVVESVNRVPTANAFDVEDRLPPDPIQFEVASIRPCKFVNPIATGGDTGQRFSLSGQLTMGCLSLQRLIAIAWDRPGRIDGAPGWLNSTYFNVVAKAPIPMMSSTDVKFRSMLRNLLTNRFKMASHYEDRLEAAYSLVADKPKLKKADPSGRPGCKENDGAGFIAGIPSVLKCQNVTMAQFADLLGNVGGRPGTRRPVVDATGLDGVWDLTLKYRDGLPRTAADGVASDPSGDVTLVEALEQQLGLKLKEAKRATRVFVLDHIEESPLEN